MISGQGFCPGEDRRYYEIQFGSRNVKVEVLDVKETVKKEEVENLYRYV